MKLASLSTLFYADTPMYRFNFFAHENNKHENLTLKSSILYFLLGIFSKAENSPICFDTKKLFGALYVYIHISLGRIRIKTRWLDMDRPPDCCLASGDCLPHFLWNRPWDCFQVTKAIIVYTFFVAILTPSETQCTVCA